MKKWWFGILFAVMLTGGAHAVSARSAIVLDGLTGEAFFTVNPDERLPMASTTKIMTALVALENCDPDRIYTVKKEYTLVEGSSMYLKEGEKLSLRDTLYGLMLMSGNDAALAIAGECGGLAQFVETMNEKALDLGLTNTHFENPNGLDGETHYTTARELALLTAYAMENPDFRQIVNSAAYTMDGRTMTNHNKLLRIYPDAVGVKTGFTKKSGRTLVSAAQRHGRRLIAVTLNDPNDWRDHMSMLENGFGQFQEHALHTAGQVLGNVPSIGSSRQSVPYQAAEDLTVWLTAAERSRLETKIEGRRFVYAPITAGDAYGKIRYYLNNRLIAEDTLLFSTGCDILPERKTRLEHLIDQIKSLIGRG